jgi:hypothetical protein
MYREPSLTNPGLLLQRPDLLGGDLAAVRTDATSQPAEFIDAGRPAAPLTEIARDYVATRRHTYLTQAWEKFAQGRYRHAVELFALAESVCLDDTAARVELEVGMMMSNVASGQYAAASNCLRWLLTPDRRTGDLPDADFLDRVSQIGSRYGAPRQVDFREHATRVVNIAVASPDAAYLQALRAVMLWARGGQAEALHVARNLPPPRQRELRVLVWPVLSRVMERSMQRAAAQAQSRPALELEPILVPDAMTAK